MFISVFFLNLSFRIFVLCLFRCACCPLLLFQSLERPRSVSLFFSFFFFPSSYVPFLFLPPRAPRRRVEPRRGVRCSSSLFRALVGPSAASFPLGLPSVFSLFLDAFSGDAPRSPPSCIRTRKRLASLACSPSHSVPSAPATFRFPPPATFPLPLCPDEQRRDRRKQSTTCRTLKCQKRKRTGGGRI